jgi:hypothetical protein
LGYFLIFYHGSVPAVSGMTRIEKEVTRGKTVGSIHPVKTVVID